ncbi:MAG: hypothetical protein JEZ12_27495 [Desulfobacterium sp.]|nr:hypothetical protein [Desulfobacterium sp.]
MPGSGLANVLVVYRHPDINGTVDGQDRDGQPCKSDTGNSRTVRFEPKAEAIKAESTVCVGERYPLGGDGLSLIKFDFTLTI